MQNPASVRICSAQISSIWEDPEKTLEKAGCVYPACCGFRCALICFPEQFATGWDPESGKNLAGS